MIGTGTVLIPWGIFAFMSGDFYKGVILHSGFGLIMIVRNILEPKLLGKKLGLQSLAALAAMYLGFKISGVAGMIVSPMILLIIKRLNDRGVISIWKS